MTPKNNFYFLVFLLALFNAGPVLAQSQEHTSLSDSNDCTDITVDYENNPNLTRQEKIKLMDKALLHSLNKYEGCQNIRASAAASGGGADTGKTGSGGGTENSGSGSSTASSDMSGTETPAEQETTSNSLNGKTETSTAPINEDAKTHNQNVHPKGSGKIPDDIPKVDNDSVLEAQIRQAAMSETDPAIKVKLWNEYRKYKGLPVQ